MKRVGIGIVLFLTFLNSRAQFLGGIFSQGATELKNDAVQIAALQALGMTADEDYEALTTGLAGIGTVHGAEYALHRQYFASLGAVNSSVAAMPEVDEILSLAPAIREGFSAGLDRWAASRRLANGEMATMVSADSTLSGLVSAELRDLQTLLTAGQLTLTDGERIARVRLIAAAVRQQYAFMRQSCVAGDLLVGERSQAAKDAATLLGVNGLK